MKFGSPQWLWALWFLPIALAVIFYDEQLRLKQFARVIEQRLWPQMSPSFVRTARMRKSVVNLIAMCFIVLALARPQFGSHEETIEVTGLDLVFALDVSSSMNVEDVAPSRLHKAKHLIRSILDRLGGDRVGIVAFAGSSYVACPLTADLGYVLDTVEILGSQMVTNQGTNVGLGLQTAHQALEGGAESSEPTGEGHLPGPEAPSKAVILISDGEDQENQAADIASKIQQSGAKFYVLGVGTDKGGPIPLKDPQGNVQGFKRDAAGQPVISQYHSDFLAGLAKKSGGKYWSVTSDESAVDEILIDLGALHRGKYQERHYVVYQERFQIPLAIAVILLILELCWPMRKSLRSFFGIWIFILLTDASQGQASGFSVPLDAYLENQKGIEAFQEGKLEQAQKNFGAAQARSPSQPEFDFNQGVVHLQSSKPELAVQSFTQAAQGAQKTNNLPVLGKSLYNLGNALSKSGELKGAVQAYVGAARIAQELKNEELGNAARKNLQLLVSQPPKKDQNKDQKEKSKEQSEQKQEPWDGQPDQTQQKEQEQQQKEQKKEEQQPSHADEKPKQEKSSAQERKQFDSKKLSQEDADRVMSELTAREKSLQEKIQNKQGRQKSNAKDW